MTFSRYRIFRYALFAFLVGVALASAGFVDALIAYTLVLGAVGIALLGRGQKSLPVIALCLVMIAGGSARVFVEPPEYFFDAPSAPFSFRGAVIDEARLRGSFQITPLMVVQGDTAHAGVMRIRLPIIPQATIGDGVEGTCLRILPVWEAPWGTRYPPLCTRSDVTIDASQTSSFWRTLSVARSFFQDIIDRGLPSPASDLLGGLLLGVHQTFSEELKEDFRRSGVSHIVAVSGYNITIIVNGAWHVLRFTPLGRRRSFWLLLVGMTLFVCLTGAAAATVRAAVMGGIVLFGQHLGRMAQSGHALLVAATAMVAWNPNVLFHVGFQLSLAATLGMIYLSPIIASFCERIPPLNGWKDTAIQTIAAFMATAPLIAGAFHTFSIVALPANLLIVPVIPFAMALGALWGGGALLDAGVQSISALSLSLLVDAIALPVSLVLNAIIEISSFFASLPNAQIAFEGPSWLAGVIMLSGYAALGFCIVRFRHRLRFRDEETILQ